MNRGKKRNFTESELEILLHEVEMRKHMLFGTLSTGTNAKQKRSEWERVCEAVNAVGSQQRTHSEIKKKWSDLKVEVKRRVSAHRRSVTATGGGTGVGELSPFDLRVAALIGDTALTGVVGAHEGDTDHPQDKQGEGTDCSVGPGVSSVGPGVSSVGPGVSSVGPGVSSVTADSGFSTGSAARGASNSSADHPTGRVLTRAVLESQAEIVRAIGGINDRLDRLINVLSDISASINRLVSK
uniref:Myb/SANT-like DNA-binding domain-containing protein n=1 Tax=Gadus morhua TaxID=8049 RepID=A0A8C5C235_GADMO